MRRLGVVAVLAASMLLPAGCPKKQPPVEPDATAAPASTELGRPSPGGLAPDSEFAAGNVQAAVLEMETILDVPGFGATGIQVDDEVKQAQAASSLKQTMMISDERGRMDFTTEDSYIPKGTQLRYRPNAKYVLADPGKQTYWVMTGSELGNLLEGGPGMVRENYRIDIADTEDRETIAGVEAVRSNAEIGFDWKVKTRTGDKSGKIKVNLAIWHSADARLKEPWGKMAIDFLAVPFQDPAGQKVLDELKSKVKFPVKWSMEVVNEGAELEQGEQPPKLITVALKLEVKDVPKVDLAYPPAGFSPAAGPYAFGDGGQTADQDLLGKIPAKAGKPPKDIDPVPADQK